MADLPNTAVITTSICCVECRRPWLVGAERWRIKVLEEDPPEAVPYCPDCHAREFGES